jgi:hypothetical protein
MSNYYAYAYHPDTGEMENACYIDDVFGKHHYGVQFMDGQIFPNEKVRGVDQQAEITRLRADAKRNVEVNVALEKHLANAQARLLSENKHLTVGQQWFVDYANKNDELFYEAVALAEAAEAKLVDAEANAKASQEARDAANNTANFALNRVEEVRHQLTTLTAERDGLRKLFISFARSAGTSQGIIDGLLKEQTEFNQPDRERGAVR